MKFRILFILFSVIFCASASSAQNYWEQDNVSKFDQMEYVKEDIKKLIAENKTLETTYAQLKMQREGMLTGAPAPASVDLNAGKIQALQESKLADLELIKRDLELQWQSLNMASGDKIHYDVIDVSDLRREMEFLEQRKREIDQLTAQEQQVGMMSPSEVSFLEVDIKRLEEAVRQIEKKVDFQKRENAIHRDKIAIGEKSSEGMLSEVLHEKKMYKANLDMLEEQFFEMEDQVLSALRRQERKNELVTQIIAYDKENQILSAKNEAITKKIHELEADAIEAAAEAPTFE